ncbi:MAG TPA: GNAT family N-acetyltransferase [Ktedonobacteraceae bacterium]|nr:GNAT family N-acetyltransferase [Ktedonobacteraceae bacterium]
MSAIPAAPVRLKDGSAITIRTARPRDASAMLALVRPIFAEGEFLLTTLDDFHMTEEREAEWLQMNLDTPGNLVIVAEAEGEMIGMLNFHSQHRRRVAHTGELGMSVHQAWRDRGVGRALLLVLLAWAEQHPLLEKVCLQVFATNTRAIALDTSLGFQEEGRQVRDIKLESGEYVDVFLMARFVK